MQAEKMVPMKLLLASIAATAGSKEAAEFFSETKKDTDYHTVVNLHYALRFTCRNWWVAHMIRKKGTAGLAGRIVPSDSFRPSPDTGLGKVAKRNIINDFIL